jgi:hypothetical protein
MSLEIPQFESSADRFEYCCVKQLYMCPLMIVGGIAMMGISILMMFLSLFNFFSILLGGTRNESLYEWKVKVVTWQAHINLYMSGCTDERPELSPC